MPRTNYALAGHETPRNGHDLWTVPPNLTIHFLSYDDRGASFDTVVDTTRDIVMNPETTPYLIEKTIKGNINGTVHAKDFKVYPFSVDEKAIINEIVDVDNAFKWFYTPSKGTIYFSDYVMDIPASIDAHIYLLACRED
ncbi:MAG: hypothetical protein COB15_13585 [Flavobacteriales bacterium]|nr:MAG: hypothetical protein COB15_13585 [Flavobacteriales bacterium]